MPVFARIKKELSFEQCGQRSDGTYEFRFGGGMLFFNLEGIEGNIIPEGKFVQLDRQSPHGGTIKVLPDIFGPSSTGYRKADSLPKVAELMGTEPRLAGYWGRIDLGLDHLVSWRVELEGGIVFLESDEDILPGDIIVTMKGTGNMIKVAKVGFTPTEVCPQHVDLDSFVRSALESGLLKGVRPIPEKIFFLSGFGITNWYEAKGSHSELLSHKGFNVIAISGFGKNPSYRIEPDSVVRVRFTGTSGTSGYNFLQLEVTDSKLDSTDQVVTSWSELIEKMGVEHLFVPPPSKSSVEPLESIRAVQGSGPTAVAS